MRDQSSTFAGVTDRAVSSAEHEILSLLDSYDKAVRAGDLATIQSFYADEFTIYDMMPPARFTDKREYMKVAWKDCFINAFRFPVTFDRHEKKVIVSGGVAYAHNLIHMSGRFKKGNGKEIESWFRNTVALEKREGQWLIVHEHNSVPIATDGSELALMNLPPETLHS